MKDCSKLSRLLLLDDIRYVRRVSPTCCCTHQNSSYLTRVRYVGETLGYHLEHIFVTLYHMEHRHTDSPGTYCSYPGNVYVPGLRIYQPYGTHLSWVHILLSG